MSTGVYDEGGVEGDESSLMTFNTILWYFYGSKFDANIDTNAIYDISTNTNVILTTPVAFQPFQQYKSSQYPLGQHGHPLLVVPHAGNI